MICPYVATVFQTAGISHARRGQTECWLANGISRILQYYDSLQLAEYRPKNPQGCILMNKRV